MREQKYIVKLREEEKERLKNIISKGNHAAREIKRANILLQLNREEGKQLLEEQEVGERCQCSSHLVYIVSKQYTEEGIERVLRRKIRKEAPVAAKITGEVEAKIIALACGEPPVGYGRWTLRLLAKRVVELEIISEISHTTVGTVLKKNTSKAAHETVLVHTAEAKCGIRSGDGGCFRGVSPPL